MLKRIFISMIVASGFAAAETYTDYRDNQSYPIIRVGETSVFAKNLNFASKGSFCYDDDPANCKKLGRLYTWPNAFEACPVGWEVMDEETMKNLEKNKKAFSRFNLTLGGFKNSKGKYELIDKRMDMWLSDGNDANTSKYWFFSTSKNNTNVSTYSTKGAMTVRCINYFQPDECNYDCSCDHGVDYPVAKEFENDKILVCTYTFESKSGGMNPTCPRDYNHYARFWKKTSPGTIEECPEPYGEEYESIEANTLIPGDNDKTSYVIHENKLCILVPDNGSAVEYKNCAPLSSAARKLTPLGREMFGL